MMVISMPVHFLNLSVRGQRKAAYPVFAEIRLASILFAPM
jgi:hypothetical protein